MDLKLADKTALVTGATSGIGRAVALELARDGASLIVSGRSRERGAETVAAIEAEGGKARFVMADLGDLESTAHLAEEAHGADILVNNAGVFAFGPATDQDLASFEAMFDINVRGTFFLTTAVAPNMARRGGGSIVNITSMAAEVGFAGGSAYGATKAALVALTRTWAAEWASDHIRVNAVSPGPTTTEGTTEVMGADGIPGVASTVPLNRPASVEEIARVVAFVASPAASYTTGGTIHTDGGRHAI
jgi:NAD(P)-dependent dehydrogenase (short-subunit alcohol dehydrogenase family)